MMLRSRSICLWSLGFCLSWMAMDAANARDSVLTPSANTPIYPPERMEFPAFQEAREVSGELVSADFVLRRGQFRTETGELRDFFLPPYGTVKYLDGEADLRDVPLGTVFRFFLYPDKFGEFTRAARLQDSFTADVSRATSYRLEEVKLSEGRLRVTVQGSKHDSTAPEKLDLRIKPETRAWKGEQAAKLADLTPGDALLFNVAGRPGDSGIWCTDIWIGEDARKRATERQQKRFSDFTTRRGIAGWIDRTEGNLVTVTFFSGNSSGFRDAWMKDFAVGKSCKLCVANDELRTWNPPVDGEGFSITEVREVPIHGYGTSGIQVVGKVNNMLEGFRRGRVARVFGAGWKAQDQFYGESLMGYGFGRMQNQELVENVAKEYPEQFPFRTDFSNEHLPWFTVKPGHLPPPFAEHLICGELLSVDATAKTGKFRVERTGETVDFTLLPEGSVKYLNAKATLADLPAGTRCRFSMFLDEKGQFTKASLITDEFTRLASNAITYRIDTVNLDESKLFVAHQLPEVKDYNGDMQRPPDIGRSQLRVSDTTRVWKGEQQVKLADLAAGDVLLVNQTAEQKDSPSFCTDIWVGADTHKLVSEQQGKKVTKK